MTEQDRTAPGDAPDEPGRKGERNRVGGADQEGHLSPQIDRNDTTAEEGQIAQDRQQSSGLGGQS